MKIPDSTLGKVIVFGVSLSLLVLIAFTIALLNPNRRLPPDGTESRTWKITAYTQDGKVWMSDGVAQDYFSETAWPRRNFGANSIRYHFFGKPTIEVVDANGIRWVGKQVDFFKKKNDPFRQKIGDL